MLPFRTDTHARGWFTLNADGPVTILIDTRSTARCGWNDRVIPWLMWRAPEALYMQSYNPEPKFGPGIKLIANQQWSKVQDRAYARPASSIAGR